MRMGCVPTAAAPTWKPPSAAPLRSHWGLSSALLRPGWSLVASPTGSAIEGALRRREATWAQRRLVAEQLHRAREAVQRQTKTWALVGDTNAAGPSPADL